MQCPLCGTTFDASALTCHSSCAFNKACAVVCCPNCGYQMVDEAQSRLANILRRILASRRRASGADLPETAARPLDMLRPGQTAQVLSIECEQESAARMERLSILGLTPGAQITLEQRQPELIVRVGYTELALEQAIAAQILVEPTPVR